MVVEPRAKTFAEALEVTAEVYSAAGRTMANRGLLQGVADEGGWGPAFSSNEEALDTLLRAIEGAGFAPGEDVAISLDVAASEFGRAGRYRLGLDGANSTATVSPNFCWAGAPAILSCRLMTLSARMTTRGSGASPPLSATAFRYRRRLSCHQRELGARSGAGARRQRGLDQGQSGGEVSEAKGACDEGLRHGFGTVVSARSGETEDVSIVHLAIGWGAGQLEGRLVRAIRADGEMERGFGIEEALGPKARFAGLDETPARRQARNRTEPQWETVQQLRLEGRLMTVNSLSIDGGALAVPAPDAKACGCSKASPLRPRPSGFCAGGRRNRSCRADVCRTRPLDRMHSKAFLRRHRPACRRRLRGLPLSECLDAGRANDAPGGCR